ncbi:MAG: DUF6992 family protein [Candidatus Cyclobacteriaceae bacterium M3_2C_046]
MRPYLISILLLVGAFTISAQPVDLTSFNQSRLDINQWGMITLGGWALGNIGINALLISGASGSQKYFYQGNAYWNLANLALAGFGLYNSLSADPESFNVFETIKQHYNIQKILLINAGLDVAYITGGFYLKERADNSSSNQDRLKGYGRALMLQGSFLLVFDLALYFIHSNQTSWLRNIVMNSHGIGMRWEF